MTKTLERRRGGDLPEQYTRSPEQGGMDSALSVLEVGDSRFLGFVKTVQDESEAALFQQSLKKRFPKAAHVPYCWVVPENGQSEFDEDGEPPGSCGLSLLEETEGTTLSQGIALVVVRFFGTKLLGVTCGRLSQCYRSVSKLALHRFFTGTPAVPLEQTISHVGHSRYGLAAGDCELILDVVTDPNNNLLNRVRDELEFGGFKGSVGEVLPRLQNLQADISTGTIPVYRYPGNYSGDEWETFSWSPASLEIKEAVENSLLPLVDQKMNHCVTNYYRNGDDFIQHHSDKDLDLNQDAVIVSVSLGDERLLELKRKAEPRDTTRILLPHGSMLVLGPKTNKQFSHSVLKKEGSTAPRISLTLRDVTTFMDLSTGRLFGQGVAAKSVEEVRKVDRVENSLSIVGVCALSALITSKRNKSSSAQMNTLSAVLFVGAVSVASWSFRRFRNAWHKRTQEREARDFFSKSSTSGTKY